MSKPTASAPIGAPTPTPKHTHTHTATAAPSSPNQSPTAKATDVSPASVKRCRSSRLTLQLGLSQGTAGTTYQLIVFTNHGSVSCSLFGYPGVSFVGSGGAQIGKPSSEDRGKKQTIIISVGAQANALLRQPDAGNFPPSACHKATAHRLRVYPPGDTAPLFVHDAAKVCSTSAGRTGIGPVMAGNGG